MAGLHRRLGHSGDGHSRGSIRAKGRAEEVNISQVAAAHQAGGAVEGFYPFEPQKQPITETGRPPGLHEFVDAHKEGDVLQPGAGHVASGQQEAIPVHQKCRAFRLVAVKDRFTLLKPILHQNKGHRGSVLISVILEDGRAFPFSET